MIIAQISDTHIACDAPSADRRLSDFARTVADINALDPQPDAIVHTGDIAHNGREDEYFQAAVILAAARAPVYVMVGNKDDRINLRAALSAAGYFSEASGFIQYAVETNPVRLLMLDTLNVGSNKGDFCADRFRTLSGLVEAETTKPIAVFAHHPLFEVTEGPDPLHFDDRGTMQALRRALRRSGRVVAMFSGHVHRSVWGQVEGIPATVMPSTATALRHGPYPRTMKTRPVYQIHRYDPRHGFITETRIVQAGPDR